MSFEKPFAPAEFQRRIKDVKNRMERAGLDLLICQDPANMAGLPVLMARPSTHRRPSSFMSIRSSPYGSAGRKMRSLRPSRQIFPRKTSFRFPRGWFTSPRIIPLMSFVI